MHTSVTRTHIDESESEGRRRPFGLRTARAITEGNTVAIPPTTYCPERQLSLRDDGMPMVMAATGTSAATADQTRHDMQWMQDTDSVDDTDAPEEE
ncbi:putative ATP-grasp-modified RiPP [Streptomyces xiamenensis]|uniref:putative ATP-grasp-modified RiPP n=1 Tax=Streptomyces xiamenensis TaxID=408015 RepID=UPI0036EAD593